MKRKKDWKDISDTEILEQIREARKNLRQLRFDFAVNKTLQSPSEIRNLKKKIARLLTLKRERELQKGKV
ncbi:MAG: 50S ribosomal protein L29 [Leptospiraceae bacterium]|nr:50S ribosomal protein L29 [Leptospiraceae bacterium]